jgi:hypothetical protein
MLQRSEPGTLEASEVPSRAGDGCLPAQATSAWARRRYVGVAGRAAPMRVTVGQFVGSRRTEGASLYVEPGQCKTPHGRRGIVIPIFAIGFCDWLPPNAGKREVSVSVSRCE